MSCFYIHKKIRQHKFQYVFLILSYNHDNISNAHPKIKAQNKKQTFLPFFSHMEI